MWKFNFVEGLNKVIGILVVAIISRVLLSEYGEYLTYQTVFGYLFLLSIFSTDYMFLVEYKASEQFLKTRLFRNAMRFKMLMIIVSLIFLLLLMPSYDTFIFWPYGISLVLSFLSFDFVLYIKDLKIGLVKFRFLSQLITFLLAVLFYFKYLPVYYITILQPVQTLVLVIGTFYIAQKSLHLNLVFFKKIIFDWSEFSIRHLGRLFAYFSIQNFLTYIISIEVVLFFYLGFEEGRNIFAEGLRITAILTPFVAFYINFNINKAKSSFFISISSLAVLLLVLAPVYTLVFGEFFLQFVFYYNFFIVGFLFNSFLNNDSISLLTLKQDQRNKLAIFNLLFISTYCFLFFCLNHFFLLKLNDFILIFVLKLIIYYIIYGIFFKTNVPVLIVVSSFIGVISLNIIFNEIGYYILVSDFIADKVELIKQYI
jgi:O-antigen/teichoic acid export membrane protein